MYTECPLKYESFRHTCLPNQSKCIITYPILPSTIKSLYSFKTSHSVLISFPNKIYDMNLIYANMCRKWRYKY